MSKRMLAAVIMLFSPFSLAGPQANLLINYDSAISEAAVLPGRDFRGSLNWCVRRWDDMPAKRVTLPDLTPRKAGVALLEIGNSGWGGYDYVLVDGLTLRSSLGPPVDISNLPLGEWLRELYTSIPAELAGRAVEYELDGSCYFLTLDNGSTRKTFAVYGNPADRLIGVLLSEMIATAAGSDDPCMFGWCDTERMLESAVMRSRQAGESPAPSGDPHTRTGGGR